jgi:Flp pilus assembly pilin Flp
MQIPTTTRVRVSRRGQGVAEYGFILVLVSLVAVGTLSTTGGSISNLMNSVASSISAPFSSTPSGESAAPAAGSGSGFTGFLNAHVVGSGNNGGFNYLGRQGGQTESQVNPDGTVKVGENNYISLGVAEPPANIPATVTLQLAPGSLPPSSVSVRNHDTGALAYGSLVPGSSGNTASYNLQPSPQFTQDMSISPRGNVALTIQNAETPTGDGGVEVHESTVVGYQFSGALSSPPTNWD